MKNFGAKWLAVAAVVGAAGGLTLNGCGGDSGGTGTAGTNGAAGRGGTTGSAGRGGTTGQGGGGTTGNAGRGGTTGQGGGGTTGSGGGGTTGAGGGTGGVASLNCPKATFDTGVEGFGLNMYNNSPGNLFTREAGAKASSAFDSTMGDPASGSIKIDAPFDDYSELVDLVKGFSATTLQDWTGGTKLHVRVKVASGFNPSANNPAGVMPYVQTTSGFVDCRKYINVVAGNGWNDYVLDFATCGATWKVSEVIGYGVQLDTGNGSNGDGGTNSMLPTPAIIYVDSFYLEGTCGGTGGTGGGTGGATGGTGGATGGTGGATGGAAGTGGGAAGTGGGAAGTGGAATLTLYDFETGAGGTPATQGWGSSATIAASTDQHFDGTQSLKVTYGALDNANVSTTVSGPALWPGTVLTFHAYLPAGLDTTTGATYFQAFTQSNNYGLFDTAGNGAKTPTAGAWNTWTYTVPNTFPGGLQVLGFQLGDNSAGTTIAAGSVYLDAITATGGTQNCAVATGTGAHTFEMADAGTLDPNVYKKDGSETDTVASQSTDQANGGTHSWKVAFTALPAPVSPATSTSRRVFIAGPNIYCGQVATVHVWLPTGSAGMTFQAFAQYNNYGKNSFTGPTTVTQNAWNTYAFTVPSDVGPGGIQQLGVQFNWAGTTAYTGAVYIDDITW